MVKFCAWDVPERCIKIANVRLLMVRNYRGEIMIDVCRQHVEVTVEDMTRYAKEKQIPLGETMIMEMPVPADKFKKSEFPSIGTKE